MALTRRSENRVVYLEVKHYSLWRALKKEEKGCDVLQVTNPRTSAVVTKYGYRFDTVSGRALKLVKYDTGTKYNTRYFGFKLHLSEAGETYVIDMPYHSQALRRFLRVARNIFWDLPISITVFKGKSSKPGSSEETGIWFQQKGLTVKPYYTREQPHGMPPATQDAVEQKWDFKDQHRWLVARLMEDTIPDIETAAAHVAPPVEPDGNGEQQEPPDPPEDEGSPAEWSATDEDVPF